MTAALRRTTRATPIKLRSRNPESEGSGNRSTTVRGACTELKYHIPDAGRRSPSESNIKGYWPEQQGVVLSVTHPAVTPGATTLLFTIASGFEGSAARYS